MERTTIRCHHKEGELVKIPLAQLAGMWQSAIALSLTPMALPKLKPQEIPFDDPDSINRFQPGPDKPFVATPAAVDAYSHEVIVACWAILRDLADQHEGIDYLQVFEDDARDEALWFIEDGEGGAITALLPSDY